MLEAFLGIRKDGRWAASRCGLAVPRQNGKNGAIEAVELYMLVVLGLRVLHSAHEAKTARESFMRLVRYFEDFPHLAEMLDGEPRRTNGQEGIRLQNGGEIKFIARTKNSGRGFTADVLIMDEAQELSEEEMAAQRFAISAAPSGDPKIILLGTPPGPGMDGAYWTRMRDTALAGTEDRLAWVEWSPPDEFDIDDDAVVAGTNPALGIRISIETVREERADMDAATFARERLGLWASESQLRTISLETWQERATAEPPITGAVTFALDVDPKGERVSIVAARRAVYGAHVEVAQYGVISAGTAWVLDWLCQPSRVRVPLVIDEKSAAAFLIPELAKRGRQVQRLRTDEATTACAEFLNAIREAKVTHFDQDELNRAVAHATKRTVGDKNAGRWMWDRIAHDVDISPLVAATFAFHHVSSRPLAPRVPRRIR